MRTNSFSNLLVFDLSPLHKLGIYYNYTSGASYGTIIYIFFISILLIML